MNICQESNGLAHSCRIRFTTIPTALPQVVQRFPPVGNGALSKAAKEAAQACMCVLRLMVLRLAAKGNPMKSGTPGSFNYHTGCLRLRLERYNGSLDVFRCFAMCLGQHAQSSCSFQRAWSCFLAPLYQMPFPFASNERDKTCAFLALSVGHALVRRLVRQRAGLGHGVQSCTVIVRPVVEGPCTAGSKPLPAACVCYLFN